MPGDVHHVVHAARDPVVSVLVAPGPVAGEVDVPILVPVGIPVTLGVLVEGAEHARPGPLYDQVASPLALDLVSLLVVETDKDAGEREGGAAGLGRGDSGERGDHDRPRLRLPPGVHDRTAASADVLVVPLPGPRVYGFT